MSGPNIWMPLYIGDYLADTAHLTIEQSGAYLHLLMSHWRVGYVPDDDAKLAAICRVTRTYFVRHIGPAIRPFFTTDGTRLTQGRMEKEKKRAEKVSLSASENAKKMHAKKAEINGLASAEAHADRMPITLTSTDTEEKKKESRPTVSPRKSSAGADGAFAEFWNAYPKKLCKADAVKAFAKALKKASAEEIIAGVLRTRWPDNPQYIPYAERWLNGERWSDVVDTRDPVLVAVGFFDIAEPPPIYTPNLRLVQ